MYATDFATQRDRHKQDQETTQPAERRHGQDLQQASVYCRTSVHRRHRKLGNSRACLSRPNPSQNVDLHGGQFHSVFSKIWPK